jgi:hypothetical protein
MTAQIKMTGIHLATAWLLFCRRRSSLASMSAPTMPSEVPYVHYLTGAEVVDDGKLVMFAIEMFAQPRCDGVV